MGKSVVQSQLYKHAPIIIQTCTGFDTVPYIIDLILLLSFSFRMTAR